MRGSGAHAPPSYLVLDDRRVARLFATEFAALARGEFGRQGPRRPSPADLDVSGIDDVMIEITRHGVPIVGVLDGMQVNRTWAHGPQRRITSVLKRPITDSARALSYESPTLPTQAAMPASPSRSGFQPPCEPAGSPDARGS